MLTSELSLRNQFSSVRQRCALCGSVNYQVIVGYNDCVISCFVLDGATFRKGQSKERRILHVSQSELTALFQQDQK